MSVPFAQIEPTTVCNLRCAMCERDRLDSVGHMTLGQFEHVLDELDGLRAVKLQGLGEPMLNPDFVDMMRALRARGIRAYSALNATKINAQNAEALTAVADRVELSLDSADAEQFAAIRSGAQLDDVVERVRVLVEARNRRGHLLELSANAVVTSADRAALNALFELASRLGLDRINLNVVQFWDVGERDSASPGSGHGLTPAEIEMMRADVQALSRRWSLPAGVFGPTAGYANCPWYRGGVYISWQGFVTPCCQRPDPRTINFGNVLEQPFETIWNSDAYRRFRGELAAGRPPATCRACTMYTADGEGAWTSSTCQGTTSGASSGSDLST
jgi:radical SAM protein with 4Fe4S-binding SPASM domain